MADWLDNRLGGICQDLQKQIEENPFLNAVQKQDFVKMLQECADKADKQPGDTVSLFQQQAQPLADKYRQITGQQFRIG